MIASILGTLLLVWGAFVLMILGGVATVCVLDKPDRETPLREPQTCPICSRELDPDWCTPRGYCCDCDEEMRALGRSDVSLMHLNPKLFSSAGRKRNDSRQATDAAACADQRPAQRFYSW